MTHTFSTRLTDVAATYLRLMNIKITASTVKKTVRENPFYPSLLSLNETLNRFKIENNAYNLKGEFLPQVETPFVALISQPDGGKDFIIVTRVQDGKVTYCFTENKCTTVSLESFISIYRDVILIAEPNDLSGDPNYSANLRNEKRRNMKRFLWSGSLALLFLLTCLVNIPAGQLLSYLSIVLLKAAGVGVAVLLLLFGINKDNAFVKEVCSAGKKVNCGAVLESKSASVSGISWSELGFFYFASTLLLLFMPVFSFSEKIFWISFANALASPYILFSIYVQWKVIKQWCLLCLAIQSLLLIELVWSLINYPGQYAPFQLAVHLRLEALGYLAIVVLLPILLWYGLKLLLVKAKDHDLYLDAYKRLQYNPEIFNSLLGQQPEIADGWQDLGIDMGNESASNMVIKVCNPYCGPCSKAHPVLEDLVHSRENIRVKIIFTTDGNPRDPAGLVVRHLLSIAHRGDISRLKAALDDWYSEGKEDFEAFSRRHPISDDPQLYGEYLTKMSEWCKRCGITHTPTIFVNGYRLPENYRAAELKHILS